MKNNLTLDKKEIINIINKTNYKLKDVKFWFESM